MYPQSILDEIRDRLSIVQLIGERIPLKKAGRNHKGLCPFHAEKTSSFMVSDEKQIFHCFGCGEGGNIFSFVMKFEGLSFIEAVEALAMRAGVTLPKFKPEASEEENRAAQKKKWAERVNQLATDYFCNNLKEPSVGESARNYLKSRDVFFEKNAQHFLGFAEDSWDGLVNYFKGKGVPLDLACELGLLKKRDGGGYYDFFRNRLMFPVIVPKAAGSLVSARGEGKVVAFSGRTLDKGDPSSGKEPPAKYLNSPDSLLYHKSFTVFGLHVALEAIRKKDRVVIVEGNLDTVRCHQEGILNVVAPLGTALTEGHLKLLSRYTKNFVVVFDGDNAGRKAAERSLPVFLAADLIPRVVALPDGEDPDSFIRTKGAAPFEKMIEESPTLFEWMIDETVAKHGSAPEAKSKVVDDLKPLFAMLKNPVELSVYRKRLSTRLMLDEGVVNSIFAGRRSARTLDVKRNNAPNLERALIEIILSCPEVLAQISPRIGDDFFEDDTCLTIYREVMERFKTNGSVNIAELADGVEEAELKKEILSFAMADSKCDDPVGAALDCIARSQISRLKARLEVLREEVQSIKDESSLNEKMKEILALTNEMQILKTSKYKRESDERTGT